MAEIPVIFVFNPQKQLIVYQVIMESPDRDFRVALSTAR